MNKMKNISLFLIVIFSLFSCDKKENEDIQKVESSTSNRSDRTRNRELDARDRPSNSINSNTMNQILEAAPPEWLVIGGIIEAKLSEPIEDKSKILFLGSRPQNTSGLMEVNGKSINIENDPENVTWISISPTGSLVLVERGDRSEVTEITPDGTLSKNSQLVPSINYIDKKRWFITRWVWLSDSELIAAMNRPDSKGDVIEQSNLYHYNLTNRTLSKVSLPSDLIDISDPYLGINGITGRSIHLRTLDKTQWIEIPAELNQ